MPPSKDDLRQREQIGFIKAKVETLLDEATGTKSTLVRLFTKLDETNDNMVSAVRDIGKGCLAHAERIERNSSRVKILQWLVGVLISLNILEASWIVAHLVRSIPAP